MFIIDGNNQFIVKFKSFGKQAYLSFGKLLEKCFREIISSFYVIDDRRVSNGKMERINRDIKTIFRSSYGSKNFIRTRNRVMYHLEPLMTISHKMLTSIF